MSKPITKARHRIHEIYSQEKLEGLWKIIRNPTLTNNDMRIDAVLDHLKDLDVTFIAGGTNRMTILIEDYIHKIALDSRGIRDNWNEFNTSVDAQPYVTKTYESNGLIDVSEYVNLISREEFIDSQEHIRAMLEYLAEDWLFCDISLKPKNFVNFGHRDNGDLVILDYGYLYPIDRKIMHCTQCGGQLRWDSQFFRLVCTKCREKHDPIDIRDRMWKDEGDFEKELKQKKEREKRGLVVLNLGPKWNAKTK
jgi:hypothetical protein